MGLQATFKAAAETIFTALDDIPQPVTYTSTGVKAYDPATGAVTSTDATYTVYMVFDSYSRREIDNQAVLSTDMMAMVPVDSLTPSPTLRDTIAYNGATWQIVGIVTDPAEALWVFQIRRQ